MSHIHGGQLATDWGSFNCPPELLKLSAMAPKITIDDRQVPDQTTWQGGNYYSIEREILHAINIIHRTGTMKVVNVT